MNVCLYAEININHQSINPLISDLINMHLQHHKGVESRLGIFSVTTLVLDQENKICRRFRDQTAQLIN